MTGRSTWHWKVIGNCGFWWPQVLLNDLDVQAKYPKWSIHHFKTTAFFQVLDVLKILNVDVLSWHIPLALHYHDDSVCFFCSLVDRSCPGCRSSHWNGGNCTSHSGWGHLTVGQGFRVREKSWFGVMGWWGFFWDGLFWNVKRKKPFLKFPREKFWGLSSYRESYHIKEAYPMSTPLRTLNK